MLICRLGWSGLFFQGAISRLQSPSVVILEPKKIESVSIVSPSICYEVMGPDAMIFISEC